MSRYRAILEYDGTDFSGFQLQLGIRTVQCEVERALSHIACKNRVVIYGSGRTDAGVHAKGQVFAFDLDWKHNELDLLRAINSVLAKDVAVKEICVVDDNFNPRREAIWRNYQYKIYNSTTRSPLHERDCWIVNKKLEIDNMILGGEFLLGEHDFASFGKAPDRHGHTVRDVLKIEWMNDNDMIIMDIIGNAFLYRMVRSIVGTLYMVGTGVWSPTYVQDVLDARNRNMSGPLAPAKGLTLMHVQF